MNKRFLICSLLLIWATAVRADFPFNTIHFYDVRYWSYEQSCKTFDVGMYFNHWYDIDSMNCAHQKRNVLQLWNDTESALSMVRGFDIDTPQGQIAAQLGDAPLDCVNGKFRLNGSLSVQEFGFGMQWHLPHDFILGVYVPFYDVKLTNVNWQDLQQDVFTAPAIRYEQLIGSDLFNVANELGCGLRLNNGYSRTGIGDIKTLIWWRKNFIQHKPILTDVMLGLRAGVNLPTGMQQDPHQLFAFPFGSDGAVGVLFGGMIQFNWKKYFIGAIDADFLKPFGTNRCRRIQVDPTQTDNLFLALATINRDYGMVQRFNLWTGIHHLIEGASFDFGYQFYKESETEVAVYNAGDKRFALDVINAAESLQLWTLHQIWVSIKYTHGYDSQPFWLKPTLQLYWTHTFKATRGILNKSIGGSLSFSF